MLYNSLNSSIRIHGAEMDYISFGNGDRNLIMIPGLGDSLKTVKGTALTFALMYRMFAKEFRVYVFSRKNPIEKNCSTRDMAADLAYAIRQLGIQKASVMGVSEGGMIAQHLAIDYPEITEKLILAVTLCKPNKTSEKVLSNWIALAEKNDFPGLFSDMSEKIYTPKRVKAQRPFNCILAAMSKPKDLQNFIIQANACNTHDSSELIHAIECPVLIIGGEQDQTVGAEASYEMARLIKGSQLKMYDGYRHGVYEECKDFNRAVYDFAK
mgnify:CR=1 FL=1